MPRTFHPQDKEQDAPSFHELCQPVENIFIAMTARKPRCILALTSINPSHQKYFSLMAKRMNVLLSARYFCLVKPESWTATTSVIKILISGRQKRSPLHAVSGAIQKRPA